MITEFGGFKVGDRVHHARDNSIVGTVVRFADDWLKENPDRNNGIQAPYF